MQSKYTTKSDVWSFGVCLWEILQLAGLRPFADLDDAGVVANLESLMLSSNNEKSNEDVQPLARPPICPKDVYELMTECWRREPADRPAFAEIHLFLRRKTLAFSEAKNKKF